MSYRYRTEVCSPLRDDDIKWMTLPDGSPRWHVDESLETTSAQKAREFAHRKIAERRAELRDVLKHRYDATNFHFKAFIERDGERFETIEEDRSALS